SELIAAKLALRQRLNELRENLDRFLAADYAVGQDEPTKYADWRRSHRPFHWPAEFYGVMQCGGFNVIIGNPPWKEYAAVRREYGVRGYTSKACGNLHCLFTERSLHIRHALGRMSFIVQLPMLCS